MRASPGNIFALLFYSIVGILLLAFFVSTGIEGIIRQLRSESLAAFAYYIDSLLSLVTAYFVFTRARKASDIINDL